MLRNMGGANLVIIRPAARRRNWSVRASVKMTSALFGKLSPWTTARAATCSGAPPSSVLD